MEDLRKLHSEGIEKLVHNTTHQRVLNHIAYSPHTKTDHLVHIMKNHDNTMAGDNAASELHRRELLGKYKDFTGKSKSPTVGFLHVSNLKDSDEIRQRYKTNPEASTAYLYNKHTPDDILFHKYFNSGGGYGSSIANHPNASKETLGYLFAFGDRTTSAVAKARYRVIFKEEPSDDTSDEKLKSHISRYFKICKSLE